MTRSRYLSIFNISLVSYLSNYKQNIYLYINKCSDRGVEEVLRQELEEKLPAFLEYYYRPSNQPTDQTTHQPTDGQTGSQVFKASQRKRGWKTGMHGQTCQVMVEVQRSVPFPSMISIQVFALFPAKNEFSISNKITRWTY